MEQILTGNETTGIKYDDVAFEQLFKTHFKALHAYASVMLHYDSHAEEIVQGMFLKLWEKRDHLDVQIAIKAYLYKCVHNDCLNYLSHKKIVLKYQDHAAFTMNGQTGRTSEKIELNELQERLREALNELPEQCRTVFQMSRFEELKYREIADQLGLSVKTIENQMGKALKILRLKLVDFLPSILLLFHSVFF
ncbi:MAG: RNA polymerase sigma-70 factor [Pedobacter sp.]